MEAEFVRYFVEQAAQGGTRGVSPAAASVPVPVFIGSSAVPVVVLALESTPVPPAGNSVTFGAGSFWIQAALLAPGAPPSSFAGVLIAGGVATFDAPPLPIGGAIHFPDGTQLQFALQLDVPPPPAAQPGPGQDAVAAVVTLPVTLAVDIQGGATATPAPFSLQQYGQTLAFTPSGAAGTVSFLVDRLILPAAVDAPSFAPAAVQSTLFQPDGSAPITAAGWSMAISDAAFDQLGDAPDAGFSVVTTGPGLTLASAQMNGVVPLGAATFLSAPGMLEAIVTPSRSLTQTFTLWSGGAARPSSLDVATATPTGLAGWIAVPGQEQFLAFATLKTHLDRPLAADGRPLPYDLVTALFAITTTLAATTVQLRGTPQSQPAGTPVPLTTLVIENAVLFAAPATRLALDGTLGAAGAVTAGSVAVVHPVNGLVPTLPDPYAAEVSDDTAGLTTSLSVTITIAWTDPAAAPTMAFASSGGIFGTVFATLLDLSGAMDQLGVAASFQDPADFSLAGLDWRLPLHDVRLFTVPEISWEPMTDDGTSPGGVLQPPDDGGASALSVPQSVRLVPVAPSAVLAAGLDDIQNGLGYQAEITLPFGIHALIQEASITAQPGAAVSNLRPSFPTGLQGANQISLRAGTEDSPAHFHGSAYVDLGTQPSPGYGASVLGFTVAQIFNSQFTETAANPAGYVPLLRYDLSGYGASVFSDWRAADSVPGAGIVQARFDVLNGRTAYEVIQAQAYLYPWAVRVVRTITIERKLAGWVLRHDSGWRAASDGMFQFENPLNFQFQLGPVAGLTSIRNITENGAELSTPLGITWQPVLFDADVLLSTGLTVLEGANGAGALPSSGIAGYLMIGPPATPLSPDGYSELINLVGAVRAPISGTLVPIGAKLKMRVSDAEVSSAPAVPSQAVVVGAVRGSPLLPSQGAWSVAQRDPFGTAAPLALDAHTPVPLIQDGADPSRWHLAEPADVNRLNLPFTEYGFIQGTGTQKVYFPQPKLLANAPDIELPLPPHFADVGALLNATGAFPNLGAALQPPSPTPNITTSDDGVSITLEWDVDPSVGAATLLGFGDVSVQLEYQYVKDRSASSLPPPVRTHVKVTISPTGWDVTLQKVTLALVTPFGDINDPILSLVGTITASSTSAPTVTDLDVVYGAILGTVQSVFANLQQLAKFLPGGVGASLDVSFSDGKLTIRDSFALPKLPLGIGFITDVALDLGTTITLSPPSLNLTAGISAPDRPFHWLVSPLSGTGCVQVGYENATPAILIQGGLGVGLAIDLGIAAGSASVVIALQVTIGSDIKLQALLTGQASVDVLDGLASAALTLTAGLGLVPEPFPPRIGTKPLDDVILSASCAVGIHISICWVVDIDFDGAWQFTQKVDVPDITSVIPI
jgi:hypothetical protein